MCQDRLLPTSGRKISGYLVGCYRTRSRGRVDLQSFDRFDFFQFLQPNSYHDPGGEEKSDSHLEKGSMQVFKVFHQNVAFSKEMNGRRLEEFFHGMVAQDGRQDQAYESQSTNFGQYGFHHGQESFRYTFSHPFDRDFPKIQEAYNGHHDERRSCDSRIRDAFLLPSYFFGDHGHDIRRHCCWQVIVANTGFQNRRQEPSCSKEG
mmetsp:Transcript_9230/g.16774  ORF Transcript_9230/g.16774 Transcript_9230/m.16774 type:complete len:205 (-) Transcript_9230:234-848(-)